MGAFGALFVLAAVASFDTAPPQLNSPLLSTRNGIPVLPIVETGPSHHAGDTADDVAIWIHPTDPSRSLVIGNDKFGGLMVWGLDGVELQYVEGTNYTNLDIRYNFPLAGSFSTGEPHATVALIAVGDEPGRQIDFFKVNPATRGLEPAGSVDMTIGPYGSCMYRSAVTGTYYSFVTARSGVMHQMELRDGGAGLVAGLRVRQFDVGTQSEGCVADDILGHYYVGEEEVGIWKYGAEPLAGSARTQVDTTGPGGNLSADVEGMSIYYAGPSTGYLLASSQGNSTIVVYAREGLNALVGKFSVGASGTIDAVTESDGLDVANFPLPGGFELGLLAVHDAMNEGATASNIKFVPWASVATALGLVVDTSWDPRLVGDVTPPTVVAPDDMTVEAAGPAGSVVTFDATATDAVSGPAAVTCVPAPGSVFPIGTTSVACSASDKAGNSAVASFDVTVRDSIAPVVAAPADQVAEATGPSGAAVTYPAPEAFDLVGVATGPTCSRASGSVFPLGTTTVTCTALDTAGNEGSASFLVTVVDTTPPSLALPDAILASATGPDGAVVTYTPSASDLVDGAVIPSCTPASGSTFSLGTTTVECTARDSRDNAATASFEVTVVDATLPILDIPDDVIVEATGPTGAVVTFEVTALDAVDGVVPVDCAPASGSTFPIGTTSVTCAAEDRAGNEATASFVVVVQDTTPPIVTVPGDLVVEATGPAGAIVGYSATAVDLVDGSRDALCVPASGSRFGIGTTSVTCTALDDAGNQGVGMFTITVRDTTPPVLTVPAAILMEATGPSGAIVTYVVEAADVVDGSFVASCSPASGTMFPLGETTVECTATDSRGNVGSASFSVTVRDTTAPAIETPGDLVAEASGSAGAAVTFAVAASDLVDSPIVPSCSPPSASVFPLGTTLVTCTARDRADNVATASFRVTVQDTTPPSVEVPADLTAEATGSDGAIVTYQASAADLVDGPLAPACSPASGSRFPLGTTTVTCTAQDAHGNAAAKSFAVSIVDTTSPLIDVPTDMIVEATGPSGAAVTFTATAQDLVDGAIAAPCSSPSGSVFPLGVTTVECVAEDSHGNEATASFTVTVRDTTPPALDVPASVVAEATGPAGAAVTYAASAVDLVDGALTPTCLPGSGSVFPLGTTGVSCTARDGAGNGGEMTFLVTVRDTTPPLIDVPPDIALEATGPDGAVGTFVVTAADLVDGDLDVACSPGSGSTFPIGMTTVVCQSQDARGNEAEATFRITVTAPDRPSVTVPADLVVEATGPAGAGVAFMVTATDPSDGAIDVACSPPSGSTFPIGTTDVTCTAEDSDGNVATGSFRITVRDTTPPAITVPADIAAEATGPGGAAVTYGASAMDAVDGAVAASCSPASGSVFPLGVTTVTCTSIDSRGNTATRSFLVVVQDTTPPAITVPDDRVVEATGPAGASVAYDASAIDLVDGPVTPTCAPASGSAFSLGVTTVTCTATDVLENVATATFDVNVRDTTPPVVIAPADRLAEATGPAGATVAYPNPQAFDVVGVEGGPSCIPASGSGFPIGTTIVTCTALDGAGNEGSDSFLVVVVDTTPPRIEVQGDITAEATGPLGAAVTYSASAVDLVDGAVDTSCSPASGSTFPLGATTVTCIAQDSRENRATSSFTVTVVDTTAPTIHVPADMVVEATGPAGAIVTYVASASDLVDGSLAPSCGPAAGSVFPLGTTTVTCTAQDAHGNPASDAFSITVRDTTPPTIVAPSDRTVQATGTLTPVDLGMPTVSDLVDLAPAVGNDAPAGGFLVGTTLVTWTATDASGNVATAVQRVVVTQPGPQNTPGKITAGGSGVDRVSNFGFIVSSCDGVSFHGQIEYQDRAAGINLHGSKMSSLVVSSDRTSGTFGGEATVNGRAGYTFRVDVRDRGEPGRTDEFTISIPELSYRKGGTLVWGNVQIHKSACGVQASALAISGAIGAVGAPGTSIVVAVGLLVSSIRSHLRSSARLRRMFVPRLVMDYGPPGPEADREHLRLHEEMGRVAREAQATLRTIRPAGPDRERIARHGQRVREFLDAHRCYEAFQELRELYALAIGYSFLEESEDRSP
jgi:myo-inositol-hexaphosphate 3-phosphohydrolase